jgi:hypothetical protein
LLIRLGSRTALLVAFRQPIDRECTVSAQLDFLNPPPDPAPKTLPEQRRLTRSQKKREIQEARARRWIDALKPIALEVAKRDGRVYAETLRQEAALRDKLPPSYGDQRSLSFLPAVFAELCREGALRKQRHLNGQPVRRYSKAMRNDQVIYELAQ